MNLPSLTEMDLLHALGVREIIGRELSKRYHQETGKSMPYAALYTTMSRLKEAGWVDARDEIDEDGRLRYFKMSALGAKALSRLTKDEALFIGQGEFA